MWKSDNTGKEDLLQEIITKLENKEKIHFPEQCPICTTKNVHLYYNRIQGDRGSCWIWCSHCRYYIHASLRVPKWWVNIDKINQENLRHEPNCLEQDKNEIDVHLNQFYSSNPNHIAKRC